MRASTVAEVMSVRVRVRVFVCKEEKQGRLTKHVFLTSIIIIKKPVHLLQKGLGLINFPLCGDAFGPAHRSLAAGAFLPLPGETLVVF